MAGPPKTTSRKENVRVQIGSALERMTEGKSFTEAVHRMAELFERALAENWGPIQPHMAVLKPAQPEHRAQLAAGIAQARGVLEAQRTTRGYEPDPELTELLRDEAAHAAASQRQFLIGHDEHTQRIVTQEELMALAAEQFPAGLVPVGIDEEADELPREVEPTLTSVTETVADEDYSYLV